MCLLSSLLSLYVMSLLSDLRGHNAMCLLSYQHGHCVVCLSFVYRVICFDCPYVFSFPFVNRDQPSIKKKINFDFCLLIFDKAALESFYVSDLNIRNTIHSQTWDFYLYICLSCMKISSQLELHNFLTLCGVDVAPNNALEICFAIVKTYNKDMW